MSTSVEASTNKASTNKHHEILLRLRCWDGIDSTHYEDIHHMSADEARGLVRQLNEAILKAEERKRAAAKARIPELTLAIVKLDQERARLAREIAMAKESAEWRGGD